MPDKELLVDYTTDWLKSDEAKVVYATMCILVKKPKLRIKVHSAAANGRWCGDQRPPCGLKTAG